jgi:hypothetical protein
VAIDVNNSDDSFLGLELECCYCWSILLLSLVCGVYYLANHEIDFRGWEGLYCYSVVPWAVGYSCLANHWLLYCDNLVFLVV